MGKKRVRPQPEPWKEGRRRRTEWALGQPAPWNVVFASLLARDPEIFDVIGGGHSFGDEVALNARHKDHS